MQAAKVGMTISLYAVRRPSGVGLNDAQADFFPVIRSCMILRFRSRSTQLIFSDTDELSNGSYLYGGRQSRHSL